MEEVRNNIFMVKVPLPGSPLREVNSYIIRGRGKNFLIDVGFNTDESEKALRDAFLQLGLKWEETDIFLTHLHADHTGCIERLKGECGKIYIGDYDGRDVNTMMMDDYWEKDMSTQKHMGIPKGEELYYQDHPAYRGGVTEPVNSTLAVDGEELEVWDYSFRIIDLSGHTPGGKGLYEPDGKFLFCGDHIIQKITPNITAWDRKKDYLGLFMENLKKVREMDIETVYSGHRAVITDHRTRVDQLLAHHHRRLDRIIELLTEGEKTIYQVALGVQWDFAGGYYGDFPPEQKWFAGDEVFAHLEHLKAIGKVDYGEDETGTWHFFCTNRLI